MILTWKQYQAQEYWRLRREYPDAEPSDCRELSCDSIRRAEWIETVTLDMRRGLPTKRQWPRLIAELGRDYINRRVFHDEPDSVRRYVDAGLLLGAA